MISQTKLLSIQIPFPKDITVLKPQLDKLYNLHQLISQTTELIPLKEKFICDTIKKAVDEGVDGVDYTVKKLGDISTMKDGRKIYKQQRTSNYIEGKTLPLIKIGDTINEYVIESDKFKNNLVYKNDILISLSGSCGKISRSKYEKAYRTNNLVRCDDIKINNQYYYYSLKNLFINIETNGSVIQQIQIDKVRNLDIKILSSSQMDKYKLQELFHEVDTLKETLEQSKQEYKNLTEELFKDFKKPETIQEPITDIEHSDNDMEQLDTELLSVNEDSDKSDTSPVVNNNSNNIIILDDVVDNNDKISEDVLDEDDSEEESEYDEIEIKGKIYILEDEQVYVKTDNGLKGKLYGYYKNNKFTKIKKVKLNGVSV